MGSEEELKVKIKVDDSQADSKLSGLGKAFNSLEGDSKGLMEAVDTGLNPSLSGFAKLAASVPPEVLAVAAAVAIAAAGFIALGAYTKFALDQATEAEQVNTRLEATLAGLGDSTFLTADGVNQLANDLSRLTGISDETITSAETVLARITSLSKEGFERATGLAADMSVAMGTDMTSAAETLSRALERPEQAASLLRRSNIMLSEAEDTSIQRMVEQGRTAQAQAAIMDAVGKRLGSQAEDVGNTMPMLQAKIANLWGNLAESLGKGPLEFMEKGLQGIIPILTGIVDTAEPALKKLDAAWDKVSRAFSKPEIRSALDELGKVATHVLGQVLTDGIETAAQFIEGFAALWEKYGADIVDTLTTIGKGFDVLMDLMEYVSGIIEKALKGDLEGALEGVTNLVGGLAESIGGALVDGIIAGIDAKTGGLISKMRFLTGLMDQIMRTELLIHSPSGKGAEIGALFAEGVAMGMAGMTPALAGASYGMTQAMTTNNYHQGQNFYGNTFNLAKGQSLADVTRAQNVRRLGWS